MSTGRENSSSPISTEEVLREVRSIPGGDRIGEFVIERFRDMRRQGRSRIGRAEVGAQLERAGMRWEDLDSRRSGNTAEVLIRGPRTTSDVALVEAWIARGLAARTRDASPDERRQVFADLVPVADHMRLLTPYDPYRMLGSFLDRESVLLAFAALTDAIVRDARALGAGRASRLRAVITQRIESLVRVLPPRLLEPFEARIRDAGGDPAIPILLDAALGRTSEMEVSTPTPSGPADSPVEGIETVEGHCDHRSGQTLSSILFVVSGMAFLRGIVDLVAGSVLGLRKAATVRSGGDGLVIVERTWLLGRVVKDRTSAIGPAGLKVLRVEQRTPLFLLLAGVLGLTLGGGMGLFLFLDGIRGEYALLLGLGVVLIGGGVVLDLVALWAAERLGARASLALRTTDGYWLRVHGLDPSKAMRFAGHARLFLEVPAT